VSFPKRRTGAVLGKTLGVPLFQEQAMQIAIVGAGFTPGEADRLRRALATFKKHGTIDFRDPVPEGMRANGYDADFAERCFPRSRASANTAFPKATPPASRCWSMPRPG
jgi:error-prone DNA polymerase